MYTGLNKDMCEKALQVVEPAILAAAARGIIKRDHGCLMVSDPSFQYDPKHKSVLEIIESDLILFKREFNPKKWNREYDQIALSKARISLKTGLSSRQVQLEAPFLYEKGMTKYGGSAVGEGGLIVAFSGVEEYFDQMISEMMLAAIKGICLHEMHKSNGEMADDTVIFLGI